MPNILLVEPGYPNKYPPLGLMKLASYHGPRGRSDVVKFVKGVDRGVLDRAWDRVYVTTLFSFEWRRTAEAIDFAVEAAGNQPERVFVGGVAASLIHEAFIAEPRWAGVRFVKGLLDGPPAQALGLSVADGDFGADDIHSRPIEELTPDYSILDQLRYRYPVRDAYFGYASRGCVRRCAFCGVPRLEGAQRDMPPIRQLVEGIDSTHGPKKDLILMDNNITASARYREIIAEIRDLGFVPGATMERGERRRVKRRVDFNQGVDARILAKSPMYLREMATICVSPLRIAFDHIGVRRVYERSVRMAADNGIFALSNYMLYNFMDTPVDLYERMKLNIRLNEDLGIRIWSFPMRYQPVTLKDRSHVGKNWNRYYLRSFQIMLQATRGIVSGNPSFFARAYGDDRQKFLRMLSFPHSFIFYRNHYELEGGRPVFDEYTALRDRFSRSQEEELIRILAAPAGPGVRGGARYSRYADDRSVDPLVRRALRYHTLDTKDKVTREDWPAPTMLPEFDPDPALPHDDEVVEDAGLFEHEYTLGEKPSQRTRG